MSLTRWCNLIAIAAACGGTAWSYGQAGLPPDEAAVERFLADRGLDTLRGAVLRRAFDEARGEDRVAIAEQLAEVYSRILDSRPTPAQRDEVERLSRELIDEMPNSDSTALRVTLARARYMSAEQVVERHRLLLASDEERASASAALDALAEEFDDIAERADRTVQRLGRSGSGRGEASSETLANARRDRSLATYYAGWSHYGAGLLQNNTSRGNDALRRFEDLLKAGDERLDAREFNEGLLRYEHLGRSALGMALSFALAGNAESAIDWLLICRESPELHPAVRELLFSRTLVVYAAADRASRMLTLVADRRGEAALSPAEARLVVVLAMQRLDTLALTPTATGNYRQLAKDALGDLVRAGEIAQVLDLLRRFGSIELVGSGFVTSYVRGIQVYEEARERHEALDGSNSGVVRSTSAANLYGEAANLLAGAFNERDAENFGEERVACATLVGFANHYRALYDEAAEWFLRAYTAAKDARRREEALWFAVVSLDASTSSGAAQEADRVSQLYLSEFPETERAATLLLKRINEGLVDLEESIAILFEVPPNATIYGSSRRQLSRLLYQSFRGSRGGRRADEAARFLSVAEPLLNTDLETAVTASGDEQLQAAQNASIRARQMLDAALSNPSPDTARARAAIRALERLRAAGVWSDPSVASEIEYRRLHLALIENRREDAAVLLSSLRARGGRFADSGDRLVLSWAVDQPAPDAALHRLIVSTGQRLLEDSFDPADRQQLAVALKVAESAAALHALEVDDAMRDLAIGIDRALLEAGELFAESLSRLGGLAAAAGDTDLARRAWARLSSALESGTDRWFEARYELFRLTLRVDPRRAKLLIDQHAALYPSLGPEPWGERIAALKIRTDALPPEPDDASGGEGGR